MKKEYSKKLKAVIIALVVVIVVMQIIVNYLHTRKSTEKLPYEIQSIEELLMYYKCTDIRIKKSSEELFETDMYLTFGKDLREEERLNEAYYNAIINYVSKLIQYKNYRMIDATRELVVAVMCNNEEQKTEKIYINGELNYFAKQQTKISIQEYKKINTIDNIQINSNELQQLIQKNWNTKEITFGSRESRYNDYDIYFEEGIELKTLGGKVYNIVFNEKYNKNVINNLKVNEKKENIINTLGKPQFEEENLIGYKGKDFYIFFSKNAISVYRIENDYQTEEFLEIFTKFQENKNAKEFVNEITNLWTDSNKYYYDSDYIYLEYALKGVCIQFNVSTENGIILYNNFNGKFNNEISLDNISEENLPEHVYLHTDEDLVFLQEKERAYYTTKYDLEEYYNMIDENDYIREETGNNTCFTDKQSNLFYLEYYIHEEKDGIREVKFVSKDRENPNSELIRHKKINSYGWLNDEEFVYSVNQEGIYSYNAKTRELKAIITGKEKYEIKKIEDNILYYDETKIKLK